MVGAWNTLPEMEVKADVITLFKRHLVKHEQRIDGYRPCAGRKN